MTRLNKFAEQHQRPEAEALRVAQFRCLRGTALYPGCMGSDFYSQNLERNFAIEPRVLRQTHLAHSPSPIFKRIS